MTAPILPTIPGPRSSGERLILEDEGRPAYAPTPLSPWNLSAPNRETYFSRSLKTFQQAVSEHEGKQPDWLLGAVYSALMNLHGSRCRFSGDNYQRFVDRQRAGEVVVSDEAEKLIHLAKIGQATPLDILKLRGEKTGLEESGMGLAKLSHPFSWNTEAMDTAVNTAIDTYEDGNPNWLSRGANRRYTVYRAVGSSPSDGLIVVRKRNVALLDTSREKRQHGLAPSIVVKRSSFVLRFDADLPEADQPPPTLQRVAHPFTYSSDDKSVTELVSRRVAVASSDLERLIAEQAKCLATIATSYYVRPADAPSPLTDRQEQQVHRYFTPQMGAVALRAA